MKYKFLSIRVQIIMALALLLSALILISYFYINSQSEFSKNHHLVIESSDIAIKIASLERDVVDIQRNVFIYKESFSNTAKNKVDSLYVSSVRQLDELSKIERMEEYEKNIDDMRFYLTEYYTNFNVVSDYVKRVEKIKKDLVESEMVNIDGSNHLYDNEVEALFKEAKTEILSYLVSFDSTHIDKSKSILRKISQVTSSGEVFGFKDIEFFIGELSNIVNLRRNYTYLVNVVMAGNANEILYNSRFITEKFLDESNRLTVEVDAYISRQVNIGILISLVGVVLTVIFGIYFFWLITQPIISIARVFDDLSKGIKVKSIPGLSRKDEIGILAGSAAVFKQKNEQTIDLLNEARVAENLQISLNKELEREKVKAENALKVRTSFLANMSHELRTPLNSIIGFTVRLIKTSEKEEYKHLEVLKTIQRNGAHLLSMINDILDLSKIEEDKLELSVSKFDLSTLLKDVIEQITVSAEEKNLSIVVQAQSIEIESDPTRLTQVLLNLLSNSVKYTERGTITCALEVDQSAKSVDIIIEDTGIGIKDEDLDRLFTRFEQFASDRTSKIGFGTGLGLAIVDNVTRLLGGESTATSKYGVGSRFIITLPLEFGRHQIDRTELERQVQSSS